MQVHDLILRLQTMPPTAFVVIGGDVIHSVEVRKGHIETGYFNLVFKEHPEGRSKAVVFLANTEMTTGEVISSVK